SKERVTETVTIAESLLFPEDGQIFPWAPNYARKATWKRQNTSKTFQMEAESPVRASLPAQCPDIKRSQENGAYTCVSLILSDC
ncbi:hypothetical protein LEMLEM_LOCUS20086, partial [Lemmus lemmus]